jgi:hypothetical protein
LNLCSLTDDPQEVIDLILDYQRRVGIPAQLPKGLM